MQNMVIMIVIDPIVLPEYSKRTLFYLTLKKNSGMLLPEKVFD